MTTTLGIGCRNQAVVAVLAVGISGLPATAPGADGEWLSVAGEVAQVGPREFTIDHGGSRVLVELGAWPAGTRGLGLDAGDSVTVSGIDMDNFAQSGRLRAFSVVNHTDDTAFRGDSDARAASGLAATRSPGSQAVSDATAVVGTVMRIDGRECIVQTADGAVRVDTRGLAFDPFSPMGGIHAGVGDRVSVSGTFAGGSADGRRMAADALFVLEDR